MNNKRKLIAKMWHCGSDCDCWQPQICEVSEINFGQPGHFWPRDIEDGPFHSEPDFEEIELMEKWLTDKAIEYQVDNLSEFIK
jgi:hypothetical protein